MSFISLSFICLGKYSVLSGIQEFLFVVKEVGDRRGNEYLVTSPCLRGVNSIYQNYDDQL
jgi:hypothetical protein